MFKTIFLVFLTFFVTLAATQVGTIQTVQECAEKLPFAMPFVIGIFLIIPFVLGILSSEE